MNLVRFPAWGLLTLGVAIGGLVTTGAYYGVTHLSFGPLTQGAAPVAIDSGPMPPSVSAPRQPKAAPIAPSAGGTPVNPAPVAPAAPATPGLQPGVGGPLIGEVTAIRQSPAGFTIRTPVGDELTYRVLDSTVFAAGRDRPYNFSLLKVGDEVRLRGRAGLALGGSQQSGQSGALHEKRSEQVASGDQPGSEPVARFVMVRPSGERRAGLLGRTPDAPSFKKGAISGLNQ